MINALKKKRIQIKQKSVKWLNDNILLENPFLWRRPIENQIIIHFDLIVMNLICALVYFLMAVFEIITYLDIYLIIFLGMIPVLFRLLSEIKPFYSEEAKVPIVGSIDLREESFIFLTNAILKSYILIYPILLSVFLISISYPKYQKEIRINTAIYLKYYHSVEMKGVADNSWYSQFVESLSLNKNELDQLLFNKNNILDAIESDSLSKSKLIESIHKYVNASDLSNINLVLVSYNQLINRLTEEYFLGLYIASKVLICFYLLICIISYLENLYFGALTELWGNKMRAIISSSTFINIAKFYILFFLLTMVLYLIREFKVKTDFKEYLDYLIFAIEFIGIWVEKGIVLFFIMIYKFLYLILIVLSILAVLYKKELIKYVRRPK